MLLKAVHVDFNFTLEMKENKTACGEVCDLFREDSKKFSLHDSTSLSKIPSVWFECKPSNQTS